MDIRSGHPGKFACEFSSSVNLELTMTWYLTSSVLYSLPPMTIGHSSVWPANLLSAAFSSALSVLSGRYDSTGSFFTAKSFTCISDLGTTDDMERTQSLRGWGGVRRGRFHQVSEQNKSENHRKVLPQPESHHLRIRAMIEPQTPSL